MHVGTASEARYSFHLSQGREEHLISDIIYITTIIHHELKTFLLNDIPTTYVIFAIKARYY